MAFYGINCLDLTAPSHRMKQEKHRKFLFGKADDSSLSSAAIKRFCWINIKALSNVALTWRVTISRVAISLEKRDRHVVTLLAMTQELIRS